MAVIGETTIGATIIGPDRLISRGLPSEFVSQLESNELRWGIFLELQFPSGTERWWSGTENITTLSQTWSPTGGEMLGIDKIVDTKRPEAHEVNVNLSPLSDSIKSKVRTDDWQEETAKIYLGLFDDTWSLVSDPQEWFVGTMQTDEIIYSENKYIINLRLESGLISHTKPEEKQYSAEDQNEEFPDDTGFDFARQAGHSKINIAGLSDLGRQSIRKDATGFGFRDQVQEGQSTRNFLYGTNRVKNSFDFFAKDPDNSAVWLTMPVADHEISKIRKVYWNNDVIWTNSGGLESNFSDLTVNTHLGTDGQSADSSLTSTFSFIDSNFRKRGVAYITVKLPADNSRIQDSAGSNEISALADGRNDITDIRDGSTGYTNNWALVYRDWMLNSKYGPDIPSARLPDSDWSQAADICDNLIETASGEKIPKYVINTSISYSRGKHEVMSILNSAAAGHVAFAGGDYIPIPGYGYSSSKSFDADDFIGEIREQNVRSRTDRPNRVRGSFRWEENEYRDSTFKLTSSSAESEDSDRVEEKTKDLPATINSSRARLLSKHWLELKRSQRGVTILGNAEMFDLVPGQVTTLDHPLFWTNSDFSVVQVETIFQSGSIETGPRIIPRVEFESRSGGEYTWTVDQDDKTEDEKGLRSDNESLSGGGPVGTGGSTNDRLWSKSLVEIPAGNIVKTTMAIKKDDDLFISQMGILDQDGNEFSVDVFVQVYDEFNNAVFSQAGKDAETSSRVYEQDFDLLQSQTQTIRPVSFRIHNKSSSKVFPTAYIDWRK